MPVVTVQLWPGKTRDQKKAMARAITEAMVNEGGIPAQKVHIIFQEVPKDSWADAGTLADE
jgi:4-oxalocrotonate tautomerase